MQLLLATSCLVLAAATTQVDLHMIDGSVSTGELREMDADRIEIATARGSNGVPLSQVLKMEFPRTDAAGSDSAEKRDAALVIFHDGSQLHASQILIDAGLPADFNGGLPYFCVPVHDLEALNAVRPNGPLFAEMFSGGRGHDSVYIYTRETVGTDNDFAARMMWPVGGAPFPAAR